MQHLMVENIRDDVSRNRSAIELPIDHDLVQRWIEAAELGTPSSAAPAQGRFRKAILKILLIQLVEKRFEVVASACRAVFDLSSATLAQ